MKTDAGLFGESPGDGNGKVVDRAEDAPAGRSSDLEHGHSSKFARDGGLTDLKVFENGPHSNRQALVQCSKFSREEDDRQTRVLAHAEHYFSTNINVVILRCTQKLLKRIGRPVDANPERSSTILGTRRHSRSKGRRTPRAPRFITCTSIIVVDTSGRARAGASPSYF